jgi:molybdate transport system substrate-binding protein
MRSAGVYSEVSAKLVLGENATQAFQFVESGNADIGLVPLSLALAPEVRVHGRYWPVPDDRHPPLEQRGVILKWAKVLDAAQRFRDFLASSEGRALFKTNGFKLPGE